MIGEGDRALDNYNEIILESAVLEATGVLSELPYTYNPLVSWDHDRARRGAVTTTVGVEWVPAHLGKHATDYASLIAASLHSLSTCPHS